MQDKSWFIASFPIPLIFRYHLPLRLKESLSIECSNILQIRGSESSTNTVKEHKFHTYG